MSSFVVQWGAKGVQNSNNGNIMNWWRSNFNMPVPDIFLSTPTWNQGRGPVAYFDPSNTWNVSGFVPGLEMMVFSSVYHWDVPSGGSVWMYDSLERPGGYQIANYSYSSYVPDYSYDPTSWYEFVSMFNVGIAGWEVDRDGTYIHNSMSTGYDPITSTNDNHSISNVPYTGTDGTAGYIWVDGGYLAIINANGWEHRILGTPIGGSGDAGYIWIDTNNDLCFTNEYGQECKVPWKIKQFRSTFSNGAPGQVYAGTESAGYIWLDSQFGYTHIAYIGYDGYKYLCGAGDYPYSF